MSNSGRTAPLALFLVIVLVAIGATIWLVGDDPSGPGGIGATGGTEATDGDPEDVDLVGDGTVESPNDLVDDGTGEAREAIATTEDDAPVPAGEPVAVRGRIDVVPGTPDDERLVVVALEDEANFNRLDDLAPTFVEVWDAVGSSEPQWPEGVRGATLAEPGGTFELLLDGGSTSAHLVTLGRYTYAMATKRVRGDDVLLPVELGAWITGAVAAEGDAELEGLEVSVSPDVLGGFDVALLTTFNHRRDGEVDAEGAFEIRGVPAVGAYALHAVPERHAAYFEGGIEVVEGERREVLLQLDAGATVRGLVVDPDDRPVANARLEAIWRGVQGQTAREMREATSDAEGRFTLANLGTGSVDLIVTADGLLETKLRLEPELAQGELREDVRIVMDPGLVLAGRVEYPDGSPGSGAHVTAGVDLSQFALQTGGANLQGVRGGDAIAGDDGAFEIRGVSESSFLVTAEIHEEEERVAIAADPAEDDEDAPRVLWRATRNAVDPNDGEVVLVLEELVGLRGTVVDAVTGEVVAPATVTAQLDGSGGAMGIGTVRRRAEVEEDDGGAFEFDELEPASWTLTAASEGYSISAAVPVSLPLAADAPPIVLQLEREASVTGLVVDPDGRPVAGATVVRNYGLAERVEAQTSGTYREVFTESDGTFTMDGLPAGTLSFVADAEAFAASEARAVDLAHGETSTGLRLELREGGVLTGEVFGDDGAPAPGMMVSAQLMPAYTRQLVAETDADGRFEMKPLEPGSWQVVALPNMMRGEGDVDASDTSAFLGTMKMGSATIVDGETTHILLGAPPENPVDVTGVVLRGGEPVEGAMVTVLPETDGGDAMGALRLEVTDEEGRFDLTLDAPAPLLVTVQSGLDAGVQNSVEYLERVPEGASEFELVLELPGGSVEGTVTDAEGRPLVGTRVSVSVDGAIPFARLGGGSFVETVTDDAGRYVATDLNPGVYAVAVGGNSFIGMLGPDAVGGREVRLGVVVGRDERVTGVDFELEQPGGITGTVVDASGSPMAGAAVFVRFEDGTLVDRMSFTTTDDAGRFAYAGLAPGSYFVSARVGDAASAESGPITVTSGEDEETRILLGPGTILAVKVVDPQSDDPSAISVSVRDEAGREYAGTFSMGELMSGMGAWFSIESQRVGPVPLGTYTVTATHADGRSRSRRVTVEGGERTVTVRLR